MKEIAEENLFATTPEIDNLQAEIEDLETKIESKKRETEDIMDMLTNSQFQYNELSKKIDNLKTKKIFKFKKIFLKIITFGLYNLNKINEAKKQKKQIEITKLFTKYTNTNAKRKSLIAKVTPLYETLKKMATEKSVDVNNNVNQYSSNSKQPPVKTLNH